MADCRLCLHEWKGGAAAPLDPSVKQAQFACLRRNAGTSISSIPLLDSASTLATAWLRALRHTLGVFRPSQLWVCAAFTLGLG